MRPDPTSTPRRRAPLTVALALSLIVGAVALVHAQGDTATTETNEVTEPSVTRPLRIHAWAQARSYAPAPMLRHGAHAAGARGGPSSAARAVATRWASARAARAHGVDQGERLARWLAFTPEAGPLVPGLVGRVPDGTEVRLHVYAGDPADGGALLATLHHLAGADDVAAFQAALREAATGATHVVVDVVGRTVALPTVPNEAAPGDSGGE